MDLLERSDSEKRHPWELARFEVVRDLVDRQVSNYKGKKILGLGCGDLYFLERFSEDKPDSEFYAVDTAFDENFIYSKVNRSIKSYRSLEDLPTDRELRFDIIFLMDVIEHIRDDCAFLDDLVKRNFVGRDTLIVITAPAYQGLFSSYDQFLGHFRRYTNSSLEELTTGAGLEIIEKGYFFFSLLLPRYVEVLSEKKTKRKRSEKGTRLMTWNKNGIITQGLKKILFWDYRIHTLLKRIGLRTPGLSNYILCKKPVS